MSSTGYREEDEDYDRHGGAADDGDHDVPSMRDNVYYRLDDNLPPVRGPQLLRCTLF